MSILHDVNLHNDLRTTKHVSDVDGHVGCDRTSAVMISDTLLEVTQTLSTEVVLNEVRKKGMHDSSLHTRGLKHVSTIDNTCLIDHFSRERT